MSKYRFETDRTAFISRALPNLSSPTQLKNEKKIVADLFTKYPDMGFWRWLKLPFAMESLTFFFGPKGQLYLRRNFAMWSFNGFTPKPKPVLEKEKVGEDRVIKRKPKTVREFLS